MALINADDLRSRFDISPDFGDDRLTPAIASASRRLQRWVSVDTYASTDPEITPVLQNAEAHLAMHFAVLGFNSPVSTKGVINTATSTSGSGSGHQTIFRYLAPKETADLAQMYLDQAQEIIGDLMLTDGTPAAPFETIGAGDECTLDTSCEAVTRTCG